VGRHVLLAACILTRDEFPATARSQSVERRHAIQFQSEPETPSHPAAGRPGKRAPLRGAGNGVLACCIAFALLAALVPFARAFYRVEVSCNEGWDVYNAALEAAHGQLYPANSGWTFVNYPMLSFVLVAQLHRWTHDYLFTGRALSLVSLLGCCLLVAGIVRKLGSGWRPALLAGFFCLALFSVAADYPRYVGMDDPQMLALLFYMAGLWIYLQLDRSWAGVALAALCFVLGISVKHNPVEFGLAVFVDLLLISRRRTLWFCACGMALLAASVGLQLHYGGPGFFAALLQPRLYSAAKALELTGVDLGPLVLPLGVSLYMAWGLRKDPRRRIAGIFLVLALLTGCYFLGGDGVSINAFFGVYLAMSILAGLFFVRMEQGAPRRAAWAPAVLFGWLLVIPWLVVPPLDDRAQAQINWDPPLALERIAAAQTRFDAEVGFLRRQPGPALCECLLRCYYAGKAYEYDPFNATRAVEFRKLDPEAIASALRRRHYGAVQLAGPIGDSCRTEMFAPPILAALRENYHPALENQDGAIYVPNSTPAAGASIPSPPAKPSRKAAP
jgi:hypothetical protein